MIIFSFIVVCKAALCSAFLSHSLDFILFWTNDYCFNAICFYLFYLCQWCYGFFEYKLQLATFGIFSNSIHMLGAVYMALIEHRNKPYIYWLHEIGLQKLAKVIILWVIITTLRMTFWNIYLMTAFLLKWAKPTNCIRCQKVTQYCALWHRNTHYKVKEVDHDFLKFKPL